MKSFFQVAAHSVLKSTFKKKTTLKTWQILYQSLKYVPVLVALQSSFLISRNNSNLSCCVQVVQADKKGYIKCGLNHKINSSSFSLS